MTKTAPRRSARVKTKSVVQDLSTDGDGSNTAQKAALKQSEEEEKLHSDNEDGNEEEFEALEDNKRKRKPIVKKGGGVDNAPPVKKPRVRGTRGVLKQIMEMPFDILYEIFSLLPPDDLLSLGRTSQDLKSLVLSADFRAIWSQSLSATDIPPCPEDISQPKYAELAFGTTCWLCDSKKDVIWLWESRMKLCDTCHFSNQVRQNYSYRRNELPAVPRSLWDILPEFNRHVSNFLKKEVDAMVTEYSSLDNEDEKASWETNKLAELGRKAAHASSCRTWREKWVRSKRERENQEFEDRKARAVAIAKELGWSDEMSKMSRPLRHNEEIVKACQKPFNDRSIEALKSTICTVMTRVKEDRECNANKIKILSRLGLLDKVYTGALKSFHPPTERHPDTADVFAIRHITALIKNIDDKPILREADFKMDEKKLQALVKEGNDNIDQKMLQLIPAGLKRSGNYNPATFLKLATTLFTNPNVLTDKMLPTDRANAKDRSFLTVPEALTCNVARAPTPHRSVLDQYAHSTFGDTSAWHAPSSLKFSKNAHDTAEQILKLCKLDPIKTTLTDIEDLCPIFECVRCNSVSEGRLIMTWDAAVSHVIGSHGCFVNSDFITVLDDADAEKVRAIFQDNKRRTLYRNPDVRTICQHCDHQATLHDMLSHIHKRHKVMYATEEDFEFAYCVQGWPEQRIGRPDGEHRMWPPRPPTA